MNKNNVPTDYKQTPLASWNDGSRSTRKADNCHLYGLNWVISDGDATGIKEIYLWDPPKA
jgi:hypothetical protein